MRLLVLNCGSSSIKYRLFDMTDESTLANGLLEGIGEAKTRLCARWINAEGFPHEHTQPIAAPDHASALATLLDTLEARHPEIMAKLEGIGHRVVHGGERFASPARIDAETLAAIRATIPLAPLHNPIQLASIEAARARFPHLPQVAVFDTAFHQTLPETAYRYAVPEAWYRQYGVRRYGFHGISHAFVAREAARRMRRPLADLRLITLHLGNGASAAAIAGGRSIDTSMGLTPLEGLVMGSRSGDLDPAIPAYLERVAGLSASAVESTLNRDSGLKGLCGDNDLRRILARAEAGEKEAERALAIYAYRVRKYVGAYFVALGGLDALVFTGGAGENAPALRARILAGLECLGIVADPARNEKLPETGLIQAETSPVAILVVRTDEELEIARQTRQCLTAAGKMSHFPSL